MTTVCITADDFGLRRENDARIVELALAGRLDAVAVMVHEDATLEHVGGLRDRVATGLHLVLVGERPLRPDGFRSILDRDGRLPGSWLRLLGTLARRPALGDAIRAEVAAQLDRYASLELPMDFVNGHQHVHLLPPIWRALHAELAARGIAPAIRVARGRGAKESAIALAQRAAFATVGTSLGSRVLVAHGLGWSGRASGGCVAETLAAIAADPPARGAAELVMHPGAHPGDAAPRHARWRYRWHEEAELIGSGALDALVERHGLRRARP